MLFVSVRTRSNFSPERKVRSTTEPESSDFSFVRTNAPPLPGFTCWKSTIRQVWPSSSMCMPVRKSLVETGAIGAAVYSGCPAKPGSLLSASTSDALANKGVFLRERGQKLDAVRPYDRQVFDPHTADARQVDPRF